MTKIKPRSRGRRVPVTIRGTRHESLTNAAKALDVSVHVVWVAKERGQDFLDRVGLHRAAGIR